MPLLPPYLVIITVLFVLLPSIAAIFLRLAVHKRLVFLESRVRRLINRGDYGNQPEIVNELERRFKEASCNLEQVNTVALIDQIYSQEKVFFLSCEQIDYFCRTLPNLLLSFGLLGTFLGITLNLSTLSQTISQTNISNVDSLMRELQKPLEGMGIAFTTSLTGIFFSAVLTVVNLIKNTSITKYKFISVLEDYLDNIYLLKVQGNNLLDKAVDRLVFEFQDFLGRFGTTVRDAVESSLGAKIQQIVDVNKQSTDLARQVYTGFQESSGTIARSATDLKYAVSAFQDAVVVMMTSSGRFEQVSQTFENSHFSQKLLEATGNLASIQSNFSESALSLASTSQTIELAINQLQNSSQKIVNLGEEISSINQTSIQVLELHQDSQHSLGEIIPQLQQGAQSYHCAVTTLENIQRQIVDEPDTLSNVQVEITNLVDILKQHTEQVNLGIEVLGDRMVNSNNYESGVLVEKLEEGINHFSNNKPEIHLTKTPIKQAKKDNLVKITE